MNDSVYCKLHSETINPLGQPERLDLKDLGLQQVLFDRTQKLPEPQLIQPESHLTDPFDLTNHQVLTLTITKTGCCF